MDFKKIFDTYSNNIDTTERSNEFAEIPPMPADVLQQIGRASCRERVSSPV